MKQILAVSVLSVAILGLTPAPHAAATPAELVAICEGLYDTTFGSPSGEPLAACQWDMSLINASDSGSYAVATGAV